MKTPMSVFVLGVAGCFSSALLHAALVPLAAAADTSTTLSLLQQPSMIEAVAKAQAQRDLTHRDKSKRAGLASAEGPNGGRHALTEKIQRRSTHLLPQHESVMDLDESALWQHANDFL